MICKIHGISEYDCDCPQWSLEAQAKPEARRLPAMVPKRLQKPVEEAIRRRKAQALSQACDALHRSRT